MFSLACCAYQGGEYEEPELKSNAAATLLTGSPSKNTGIEEKVRLKQVAFGAGSWIIQIDGENAFLVSDRPHLFQST